MSIRIATIEVHLDGDAVRWKWTVEPEAHTVGLSAATGSNWCRMGDDLGTPEGAGAISAALAHASSAVDHRVRAAWNGLQPLF